MSCREPRRLPSLRLSLARRLRALIVWSVIGTVMGLSACAGTGLRPGGPAWTPSIPDVLPTAAVAQGVIAGDTGARAASVWPGASAGQDGSVALHATPGRTPDGQGLLLKVDYAATAPVRADRPPLNIALVFDSSASMAEANKLRYTLDAARMVIENLTDRDSVALVAFSDRATVLSGAGRVVNKPFLYHRLDEITPQGTTNLSAGLLEGMAQVDALSADGQVRQIFLLTDGRANRGETKPAALRQIVQEAKARGIGLSTFGVGSDFNEALIADMAAAGGGRYTYVKSPEQIPTAFQEELQGLLQVVAQNASLEVTTTNARIGKVYGQLRDEASASFTAVIGDLRATERGFVLMEVLPLQPGAAPEAQVRLVYDDPQAGGRVRHATAVRMSPDAPIANDSVAMLAAILDAVERAVSAVQGLDIERYGQIRASFDQVYQRARELALRTHDQELLNQTFVLKHFMGELGAAEQGGLLHSHREAREKLRKESHYLRYLLSHHRPQL